MTTHHNPAPSAEPLGAAERTLEERHKAVCEQLAAEWDKVERLRADLALVAKCLERLHHHFPFVRDTMRQLKERQP